MANAPATSSRVTHSVDTPAARKNGGPFQPARMWERPAGAPPCNALTCDVEDYFQVSAFEHLVPRSRWDEFECRIPRNVDLALQLFADAGVKGTFFTLGWVAERYPAVVRRIAEAGHEVASHGMRHERVFDLRPDEFRENAARAKTLLEDAGGVAVNGYRAPSWSFDERTPWAYSILREVGYSYSSSLYPVAHDHYGVPGAPTEPFYVSSAEILEIPASTLRFAGRNWPAAGGGFFRLLPLPVSLWMLRRIQAKQGTPTMFYFHPWELDPEQPRIAGVNARAKFRHYLNLDKMQPRLAVLLKAFRWDRMDRVFATSA
jgi:polysaccharide deacetylase family protein (PEP-CTERM system associated)